jgi:diaminopropionate ammonia-lyase
MDGIKWTLNSMANFSDEGLSVMSREAAERTMAFHSAFPEYSETPLADLRGLAAFLGLSRVFIKDESKRFGLQAFKVLGGSYAIAASIAKAAGVPLPGLCLGGPAFGGLTEKTGVLTFFTATDGNHGRGVAWAAKRLGHRAVVLMPKGTTKSRLENIKREGAEVTIEDLNYDECVRKAARLASEAPNGVLVQDTAWEGYEEIPSLIMQGYGTMAAEADREMAAEGANPPTHIFLQAGVGTLAGAVAAYFANKYREKPPIVAVVEADKADCHYRSALASDGEPHAAGGDMNTMMAGLACGEPNIASWKILRNWARCFVSCPDWVAAQGMRVLGAPLEGDARIISGESGAVTAGLLYFIMRDERLADLREAMQLGVSSNVLLFSTEGDTDPENYRRVVWDGYCAAPEPWCADETA